MLLKFKSNNTLNVVEGKTKGLKLYFEVKYKVVFNNNTKKL